MPLKVAKSYHQTIYFKAVSVLAICVAGALIYSNSLSGSFHFDDKTSILLNPAIKDSSNLLKIWSFWPTRFITYFSFALNYHFHKLDTFGYHLVNLIIHLICSVLVWWFCILTFSTSGLKDNKISRHCGWLAFFAGLVFVSHPVQTQAVTYIIQRAASLTVLFYMAALCFYVKSRLEMLERQDSIAWKIYYCLAFFSALLAMFTKEMAISLPLAILLYEFYFLRKGKNIERKYSVPFWVVFFIIPATLFVTSQSVKWGYWQITDESLPGISRGQYLLTQFRVMVTYLRLLILPVNQNLDYDYPLAKGPLDPLIVGSFIILTLILLTARRISKDYRLISFGIFWFFLTLLPESSIIPIKDVIFEHRLYLPMVGFSILMVATVYYLLGKKPLQATMLLFAAVACYSMLTYQRNLVWKDELTLWSDVISKSPRKYRPYYMKGIAYIEKNDMDKVIHNLNKCLELNPRHEMAYYNRAVAYYFKGNYLQSWEDLRKAEELGYRPKRNFLEVLKKVSGTER